MQSVIQSLEQAISGKDPLLLAQLQPPLAEKKILRLLNKFVVEGAVEPIYEMYRWRNGIAAETHKVTGTQTFEVGRRSFLPHNECTFLDLEHACIDFQAIEEVAVTHPQLRQAVGRFFPIFAVGDVSWLATDLKTDHPNKVVLLDWHEAEAPFREIYSSFESLLIDLTRAHVENCTLQTLPLKWKGVVETWYE